MKTDIKLQDDSIFYTVSTSSSFDDKSSEYDGVVLVCSKLESLPDSLSALRQLLVPFMEIDAEFMSNITFLPVPFPFRRLIFSPTGCLSRDYDDVRRFYEASSRGIERAVKAGCRSPLLICPSDDTFEMSVTVTVLGALSAVYVPVEIRKEVPERRNKVTHLGVVNEDWNDLSFCAGVEEGKLVCRDIMASDPVFMCPASLEVYVKDLFEGSSISVSVVKGQETFVKEYPLFAAVNRGSEEVDMYRGSIIYLEYIGEGAINETLLLVGKGVTYDTGGHDLKAGGVMAGMHRDKGGAAAVVGFFRVLSRLKPRNVKVVGGLAVVRNAIGVNAYVSDEIITSRAGVRVRIGNTDAEGRMIMADVLCKMKEQALTEVNPQLMTLATLTGHAPLAFGEAYSVIMDNGPAKKNRTALAIQKAGDSIGDMLELSTIRREDYEFNKGKSEYEDACQSNNLPSTRTPRGHQVPAAFLIVASGLDKHGIDSSKPLKYTHIDLAGCGEYPDKPTASPVAALAKWFIKS